MRDVNFLNYLAASDSIFACDAAILPNEDSLLGNSVNAPLQDLNKTKISCTFQKGKKSSGMLRRFLNY